MVQLVPGTPAYEEVFGGFKIDKMTSQFPSYAEIIGAGSNPSLLAWATPEKGGEILNAMQLKDLQRGARYLFDGLAVIRGNAPTGLPSFMLGGLKDLIRSADIEAALPSTDVVGRVMNADSPAEVAGVLLGAALASFGVASPVVGIIAGLVVALATGVHLALQSVGVASNKGADEQKELMYRLFPELQVDGSETDVGLIEDTVRPAIESFDWSGLYMPRWKGGTSPLFTRWAGFKRQGGFAFAPADHDAIEPTPTGHLGCVPGTSTITDMIQVSLPHGPPSDRHTISKEFYTFLRGGLDPRSVDSNGVRGKTRVTDTGSFYPTTARLCGMLWNWAMQAHNPMCFRIDANRIEDPWKTYCDGGIEFIRRVCYPWAKNNLFNSRYKFSDEKNKDAQFYIYDPNADFEGYYGTAIFHAIGAFACNRPGNLNLPPTYTVQPRPYGLLGAEIGVTRAYGAAQSPVWSNNSGPWLPIVEPAHWPDKCMGTRFHRGDLPISKAIAQLRARQRWNLKGSPVAVAACREQDAAFVGDPQLLDQLRISRAALLSHSARHALDLDDAAAGEPGVPGRAGSWREQLAAAGVTPGRKFIVPGLGLALGSGKAEPLPDAGFAPGGNGNPWDPAGADRVGRNDAAPSGGGGGAALVAGGLIAGGLVAGGLALARRRGRRR